MRIAYLAQSVIPSRTANSIHVMKMAQAFALHDHDVTLIVPDTDNREPDSDNIFRYYNVDSIFDVSRAPSLKLGEAEVLFGIAASMKAKSALPNLVYGRDLLGCYLSAKMGMQVVYEAHAPILPDGSMKARIFKWMVQRPHCRRVVVISEALKRLFLDDYPHLANKLYVAHDAADPPRVDPGETNPIDSFRGEGSEGEESHLQVGYIGHLYKGRGVELMAEVARACDWADVHLVGGTDEDVRFWRNKLAHIENLHIHGFQPPARAEMYRLGCDVLLAPYQRSIEVPGGMDTAKWMSPLKVFEYMAAGKAILASDLSVLKEVLTDQQNALLCAPDDPQPWIRALEELHDNPKLRQQLGSAAQVEFRRQYTWQARAKHVIQGL